MKNIFFSFYICLRLKVYNISNIPKISLLECELETGRTHQIRVHMTYKGVPLLGDKQYGKKNIRFKRIDKNFEKNRKHFTTIYY